MTTTESTPFGKQLAAALRFHPRVVYQDLNTPDIRSQIATTIPNLIPFGQRPYVGFITVLDWDHFLPSRNLVLRIYAYTTPGSLAEGEAQYQSAIREIAEEERFPEFDVPGFEALSADEAYEGEVSLQGLVGPMRLVSMWRRDVDPERAQQAVEIARKSSEFQTIATKYRDRSSLLGDLEAVGWCPPCESQYSGWCLDVWYLTNFDGRLGTGQSLLVDLNAQKVILTREFAVRAG